VREEKEVLTYLRDEFLLTLSGRLGFHLHRHLSAILQESIVDFPEATLTDLILEVFRDPLQLLVGESPVLKLQRTARHLMECKTSILRSRLLGREIARANDCVLVTLPFSL
jgi:hypothetical protein